MAMAPTKGWLQPGARDGKEPGVEACEHTHAPLHCASELKGSSPYTPAGHSWKHPVKLAVIAPIRGM